MSAGPPLNPNPRPGRTRRPGDFRFSEPVPLFRRRAGPPGAALRLPRGWRARADAAPAVPARQGHLGGTNFVLGDLFLFFWACCERGCGDRLGI